MAQNKADLLALISGNLPDNTTGLITPQKHREVSTQISDSALNTVETGAQSVSGETNFTGGLKKSGSDVAIGAYEEQILYGSSTAVSQLPSGLGVAMQIEFGAAQLGDSDPVKLDALGNLTINETGKYLIRVKFQHGRAGASGLSILHSRFLVNGSQVGISSVARLESANEIFTVESKVVADVTAGDIVTFEMIRDSAGADFGGLYSVASSHGWNLAPTSLIAVSRVVGAY